MRRLNRPKTPPPAAKHEPPLTPSEIRDSEVGWAEYLAGKSKPLKQVVREQLRNRHD